MKPGKQVRGVIFDVDGVLLDSMKIWNDLGARYLTGIGKKPEEGISEILFSMSMEQGAEYLKSHYDLSLSVEEILTGLRNMLRDFYFYEVQAKPGAKELLGALREAGIPVTAATSSPREHITRALERTGLLDKISRMFTNSEIGRSKHFPDIYDAAAQFMETEPEETWVCEDSLYALKTAANAGYRTVGVFDERGEPDQEGLRKTADLYIRDLRGLNDYFLNIKSITPPKS